MPQSLYGACLRRLGLSHEGAGAVHARYGYSVRPDTIASWASGRREAPFGVYEDLQRYAAECRAALGRPADIAEAVYLAEQISPSIADDHGFVSELSMAVALADRLLSEA